MDTNLCKSDWWYDGVPAMVGLLCTRVICQITCVTWLKSCSRSVAFTWVTWLIQTLSRLTYVGREASMCVTCLIHMCDKTRSNARQDSKLRVNGRVICVCDSFTYVTWLIHMCDMTRWHEWHHSCIRVYTLQHTATHCNTLQYTATHCNTLQHDVWHESLTWMASFVHTCVHTATLCDTLRHTATHCNTLQQVGLTTLCNTLWHTATLCDTLQHTHVHGMTHAYAQLWGCCD